MNEFYSDSEARKAGVVDGVDDYFSAMNKIQKSRNNSPVPSGYKANMGQGAIFLAFIGIGASVISFMLGLSVARESLVASGVLVTIGMVLFPLTIRKFVRDVTKKDYYSR